MILLGLFSLLLEDGVLGGVAKGGLGVGGKLGAATKAGAAGYKAGGIGKVHYGGLTGPSYGYAV